MTAEPSLVGREPRTNEGDVRLFLWEKPVMPGIARASFQQKNYRIPYHILQGFFSQPASVYRGH